jgi:hypothetical protein
MTPHDTDALDVLQSYRLGSRQATRELQREDSPAFKIEFEVLRLVQDVARTPGKAIILCGTAGDGKTYIAFEVAKALGLDPDVVRREQRPNGYSRDGVFVDLDLSAGVVDDTRARRVYDALSSPARLSLVCANEGKLAELRQTLSRNGLALPPSVILVNLSRRAIVSRPAWEKTIGGILESAVWAGQPEAAAESAADGGTTWPLSWNRDWLRDPGVRERIRRLLLVPYLLGEPITVREVLSCFAYALGGGLSSRTRGVAGKGPLPYLLFNTLFGEPDGYAHGGRNAPSEKLLWWLYRFDPADRASPETDLHLLIDLNGLEVAPPAPLLDLWRADLVAQEGERSDSDFKARLARYMRFARRWYALASETGFWAYFPFRHFQSYVRALDSPTTMEAEIRPQIIRGLNLVLSGGAVSDDRDLRIFYAAPESGSAETAVYSSNLLVEEDDLSLVTDLEAEREESGPGDDYLERLPRRLLLRYEPPSRESSVSLPVSLLLYEVLLGAAGSAGGFPATLWAKERDTVRRFAAEISRVVQPTTNAQRFTVPMGGSSSLQVTYFPKRKELSVG